MSDTNITMVAYHGNNKSLVLQKIITIIQNKLKQILGSEYSKVFKPFTVYQIHATLIGMEVAIIDGMLYGHWFLENRREKHRIDIDAFITYLKQFTDNDPLFTIRFHDYSRAFCTCEAEGFRRWTCHTSPAEFHSCGRSAYEGSFYASTPGPAVITGWPIEEGTSGNIFPHSLYAFRKECEKTGFLDKYHSNIHPYWMDDDFYVKIGYFTKKIHNLADIIEKMRDFMCRQKQIDFHIRPDDVDFVLYKNSTLQRKSIIEKLSLKKVMNDPETLHTLFNRLKEIKENR